MRLLLLAALALSTSACASLHRAQLDEIDARGPMRAFELHVSSAGVDTQAVGNVASAVSGSSRPSQIAGLVALFQFGPKTGSVVYDDAFADRVAEMILARCPTGRVTGLLSLRESTSYYAVSGEYVTIRGFCLD